MNIQRGMLDVELSIDILHLKSRHKAARVQFKSFKENLELLYPASRVADSVFDLINYTIIGFINVVVLPLL